MAQDTMSLLVSTISMLSFLDAMWSLVSSRTIDGFQIWSRMNPVGPYSPFVEHSFRRLSHVIHQQEALNHKDSNRTSKNTKALSPYTAQLDQSFPNNIDSDSTESRSGLRSHRTYMRPPKSRTNRTCKVARWLIKSLARHVDHLVLLQFLLVHHRVN